MTNRELLDACLQEGAEFEAWREFVHRFQPLITGAAASVLRLYGLSRSTHVDDATEEIFLKLCLNDFELLKDVELSVDDALFGYIKTVAANATHDYCRGLHAARRIGDLKADELNDETTPSPDSKGDWAAHTESVIDFQKVLDMIPSEPDRLIFVLHYRIGLSARQIAELLNEPCQEQLESRLAQIGLSAKEIAVLSGSKLAPKGVESKLSRTFEKVMEKLRKKK